MCMYVCSVVCIVVVCAVCVHVCACMYIGGMYVYKYVCTVGKYLYYYNNMYSCMYVSTPHN